MNPRLAVGPSRSIPVTALLMAAGLLILPGASALAGCDRHVDRPSVALDWSRSASPIDPPADPGPAPACSGWNCSRPALPPIASTTKAYIPLDPYDRPSPCLDAKTPAIQLAGVGDDGPRPIDRATEISRPPRLEG